MIPSEIRIRYVEINKQMEALRDQQKVLADELIKIMEAEPDVTKREEIVDMVFADKVQQLHEHYFRKIHIEGRTDLL